MNGTCMSCTGLHGRHFDNCLDYQTQRIVYPTTMEAVQMEYEGPAWDVRWLWASVVCLALGLPLTAMGSVFRHEVAQAVWSWLR